MQGEVYYEEKMDYIDYSDCRGICCWEINGSGCTGYVMMMGAEHFEK